MLESEVVSFTCNWFHSEYGDEYKKYEVGKDGVKKIVYVTPFTQGRRDYCDVIMESGELVREFNLNTVKFA